MWAYALSAPLKFEALAGREFGGPPEPALGGCAGYGAAALIFAEARVSDEISCRCVQRRSAIPRSSGCNDYRGVLSRRA